MEILFQIWIGVVSGVLIMVLTWGYRWFSKYIKHRKIDEKIMPLNRNVQIIISSHKTVHKPESTQQRIMVTAGSVLGLSKLFNLFNQFKIEPAILVDKFKSITSEKSAGVEICIGSPTANSRTQYYLRNEIPEIFNGVNDKKTVLPNDARIIKLTLHKTLNKVKKGRTVIFLIYGYYTLDTIAAMRYFSENFDLIKQNLSYEFCSIMLKTSTELGNNHVKQIGISYEKTNPIRCDNVDNYDFTSFSEEPLAN